MTDVVVVKVKESPVSVVKIRGLGPQGIPGPGLPAGNPATQAFYVPRYIGPGQYDYQLLPLLTTAYNHIQASPAATWNINHNLGYRPSVELLDSGGNEIEAEISHVSENQVIVSLNPPSAGLARLT